MIDDIIGLERAKAACQAAQIETYWHNLGHTSVRAWIEKGRIPQRVWHGPSEVWFIRSNLVNGRPPE